MPTVFSDRGLRFFFYSDEGDPREPVHVHVKRDRAQAKFWIGDDIVMAYNDRLSRRDLALAMMIIRARKGELIEAWNVHFR